VPFWVVITCQAAIGLGTLIGGWRIVRTVGSKITRMTPVQGCCASAGGAIMLFAATYLGIPVSTTRTVTGSVIGVGAARKVSAVRWNIAPNIVIAWIVTLPASGLMVALCYEETRSIPIVFVGVSDPVGSGFVTSLARPGGDLTGMMQYESGIMGKWLAMLKEVAPRLARLAFVANPKFRGYEYFWRSAEAAARALAIEIIPNQISNNTADIEHAIESFAQMPEGGLLFVPDATIIAHRDLVITLAARYRLPAVYPWRYFVSAGALMSYGIDNIDVLRIRIRRCCRATPRAALVCGDSHKSSPAIHTR
jgi:hypothetical protein